MLQTVLQARNRTTALRKSSIINRFFRTIYNEFGLGGFEPPTPGPPDRYAKPLRYSPICEAQN